MSAISAFPTANTLGQLSLPLIQAAVITPKEEQVLSPISTPTDTVTISPEAVALQRPHR